MQMFMKMMVGVVDKLMVGQLGESAIAGVGISDQLIFFLIMMFAAVGAGVSTLTSQYIGARSFQKIKLVFGTSIVSGIIFAIFFNVIFYYKAEKLLSLMGAAPEIIANGVIYLKLVSFSIISVILTFMMTAIFRSFADNKTPMFASFAAMIINTALAYILIFHFNMGVAGSGYAALTARTFELFMMFYYFEQKSSKFNVSIKHSLSFSKQIFKKIFTIGWPISIDSLVWQTAGILQTLIILKLGTIAAGVNEIMKIIQGLVLMPVSGIAFASAALIGHDLGRGDFNSAKLKSKEILKISFIMVLFIALLIMSISGYIPGFFNFSPEGKILAAKAILIIAGCQIFQIFNMCYPAILRSGGDTKAIIYISGAGMWIFGLPLSYLFGIHMNYGFYGAIIGANIGEAIKAVIFYLRYKKGLWMKKLV
ncbi:MAG: MATE family efflux transporter [Candidatus Wallbacteria bacterium]